MIKLELENPHREYMSYKNFHSYWERDYSIQPVSSVPVCKNEMSCDMAK